MATLSSPCLPASDDMAAPLGAFLQARGLAKSLQERPPSVAGGKPLDLCKLYKAVRGMGGFMRVAARDQWPAVADALFPASSTTMGGGRGGVGGIGRLSLAVALAVAYRTYLIAFEQHRREQEEQERGAEDGNDEDPAAAAAAGARGLKRPRPGAAAAPLAPPELPSSASTVTAADAAREERVTEAVEALATATASSNTAAEVKAINDLNRLSADGDFELLAEHSPGLLDAVADALDRHNAPLLGLLRRRLARLQQQHQQQHAHHHHHRATDVGDGAGSAEAQAALAFQHAAASPLLSPPWLDPAERALTKADPGPVVLGLCSLLRNLSYIVANEEPLAYHPRLLMHLVSLLPASGTTPPSLSGGGQLAAAAAAEQAQHRKAAGLTGPVLTGSNAGAGEAGAYACETLASLGRVLDVRGIPLSEEELLAAGGVPDDSLMALAPASVRARCAPQAQDTTHQEFISLVVHTFPTLVALVSEEDRPCVLRALDCLARLLGREDNAQLVARYAPPAFLTRLHELLYVPVGGADAMPTPGQPLPPHPNAARYQQQQQSAQQQGEGEEGGEGEGEDGAAAAEATGPPRYAVDPKTLLPAHVDTELRDASLEVLSLLCAVPEAHPRLLDHAPGLLRSLVLLLRAPRTGGGHATGRPEAAHMAARMLVVLASEDEGTGGRGRAEVEGLRHALVHYALRPGGDVAAECLWALFLAPPTAGGGGGGGEGEEGGEGSEEEN